MSEHETGSLPSASSENIAVADRVSAWRDDLKTADILAPGPLADLDHAVSEARAGRLETPPVPLLTILLLGATGGGKSALLNALAGAEIARSHHLRPTTSEPSIYLHESISPARLHEYGPALGALVAEGGAVLKTHQREDLRNKVIIDAPDIDSYKTAHREAVLKLLPVVDVALYVVTPFSYKDDLGWSLVLQERGRRAFAFVMNKWDAEGAPRVSEGEHGPEADFVRMVEQSAGYGNPRLFLTSARYWAADPESRAQLPPPAAGENFADLRAWLEQGLSTSLVEQIQRRRRRALWGVLTGAIESATPGAIDEAGILRDVERELESMITEGRAAWQPVVERRTEALARRREEEARPRSFGPFGWLSSALGIVIHAGKTWRRVAEPEPDISVEDLHRTAERSAEIARRKLERIEWHFRQNDIPAGSFVDTHAGIPPLIQEDLLMEFEKESESVFTRIAARWRSVLGWTVLAIFELLTAGLLILAAWRLVEAFVAGSYLNLTFTINLVALLLILLLTGSAVMAVLFPPVKARIRRVLTDAVAEQWLEGAAELEAAARDYIDRLIQLRETGKGLQAECHAHISAITREMDAIHDTETEHLFADQNRV